MPIAFYFSRCIISPLLESSTANFQDVLYLDLVYVALFRADGLRATVSLRWYGALRGASHCLRYSVDIYNIGLFDELLIQYSLHMHSRFVHHSLNIVSVCARSTHLRARSHVLRYYAAILRYVVEFCDYRH
jgi:hypothetical protein